MENIVKIFTYKGKEIYISKRKNKYIVGIHGDNNIYVWFDSIAYTTLKLAVSSGCEYARIILDKILLERKQNYVKKI